MSKIGFSKSFILLVVPQNQLFICASNALALFSWAFSFYHIADRKSREISNDLPPLW